MICNGDGVEDVIIAMKRYHQKIFFLVRKKYAKCFADKYEDYTFV